MRKKCEAAGHVIKYSAQDDSFYCETCNEWLEATCGCQQCNSRPLRPSYPRASKPVSGDLDKLWV